MKNQKEETKISKILKFFKSSCDSESQEEFSSSKDLINSENKCSFHCLSPDISDENCSRYKDNLDFAFDEDNKSIKNIAITGIYGSGKSSVIESYIHAKGLDKSTIRISLGSYVLKDERDENNEDKNKKYNEREYEHDKNDRLEKQIINQILYQVDSKKIPLCKYERKQNTTKFKKIMLGFFPVFLFLSVFLYVFRSIDNFIIDSFIYANELFLASLGVLFILSTTLLIQFILNNRFKFKKINFRGTEAEIDDYNDYETALDYDIKEIVYILSNSDKNIILIEDLDRFDNVIDIITKLREICFLVNLNKSNSIKFVYVLRDGVFDYKDRVKFFDFIIPIIPILDSSNADTYIEDMIGDESNHKKYPDKSFLFKPVNTLNFQ